MDKVAVGLLLLAAKLLASLGPATVAEQVIAEQFVSAVIEEEAAVAPQDQGRDRSQAPEPGSDEFKEMVARMPGMSGPIDRAEPPQRPAAAQQVVYQAPTFDFHPSIPAGPGFMASTH